MLACSANTALLLDDSLLLVKFPPFLFISLFWAVLDLYRCEGFSLVAAGGGFSLVTVLSPLISVAALFAEHRFYRTGSVVVVLGLTSLSARGIFPDQGLNLCFLHFS